MEKRDGRMDKSDFPRGPKMVHRFPSTGKRCPSTLNYPLCGADQCVGPRKPDQLGSERTFDAEHQNRAGPQDADRVLLDPTVGVNRGFVEDVARIEG